MYTILLVEDEDEARRSIRELTPWKEYGFRVIAEASNGREALEIVSDILPDVIITDIRMPYMDGIEFIERVREEYSSSVDVIILSGYDEFTFAQTAMRLNVSEYVLKPVSVDIMKDVLKRTRTRLDADVARVSDMEKLQNFYRDAFSIYREKFLISLIIPTRRRGEETLEEKAKEYGIPLSGKLFAAAVIDLPSETLSSVAMEEILGEAAGERDDIISFQYENQEVLIFISGMEREFQALFSKQIFRTLNLLQSRIVHYFSRPLCIGVGEIVTQMRSLPESYRGAVEALNYTALYPEQHIISINDVENAENESEEETADKRTELVMAIKFGNAEDTENAVHTLLHGLTDTANIQNTVLNIISVLSEICTSYGRNVATLLDGEDLFISLSHANTLSRAEKLLTELAVRTNETACGEREISHIRFIENAKRIIKEKYSDPSFGLDQLAEEISVSPAYFSTTFKKETGMSFVQYLTNVRLEKAKEMLRNSDYKTYEIAEKTGFSEPNYFSFTFKKNVGLSPSQYRSRARE